MTKQPSYRFTGLEDDWKEVKLGEVFDIVTDYVANGSFESLRNNVKTYEKDNFAYMIRLQDASNSWKGHGFIQMRKVTIFYLRVDCLKMIY